MDTRYKVEKILLSTNAQWNYLDQELDKIIPQINDGTYADDGWVLTSITPITAYQGFTSHLVLLFKRL